MEIDVPSDEGDWEVLLRTWYEGRDRDAWIVYRTTEETLPRYAARHLKVHGDPGEASFQKEDEERSVRAHERTVLLEASSFQELLDEGNIPVPVLGFEPDFGLDGWTIGYARSGFLTEIRLAWWCEGPEAWRPFTLWVERLQRHLRQATFPNHPHRSPATKP